MSLKYKDLEGDDIENREVIRRSIKNIVSTPKGTIPAQPTKGSKIMDYIFSDLDELDVIDLESYVDTLVTSNEPRVDKVNTKVTFAPEYNRLTINVQYRILTEEETDFTSISITV